METDGSSDESVTIADLRTAEKPVRDARAYGVNGDSETDHVNAIQSTFDAADDGDAVYFSPENYVGFQISRSRASRLRCWATEWASAR